MNNKKSRFLALILVLAMVITASVTGCKPKDDGGSVAGDYVMDDVLNPIGSDTICKEKVTLEFMMSQNGTVTDYDTNAYTQQVEKIGNVEIKFNLLPQADATKKINLVLSSGSDLPDVIIASGLDERSASAYGESGTILALNKYYENSSEYLMPKIKAYEENTGVNLLDYITMSDGNIYTIPNYSESLPNEFPTILWVYQPWLDKLGMDAPETLDEFVEVLKAFRDNDLNGNGSNGDEIPLIDYARDSSDDGFMLTLLQAFIKTGAKSTVLEDGEVSLYYTRDEYKEFLKFMKMLYDEGLLDQTTFSQDQATLKTLINGETTRVGTFCALSPSLITAGSPRRENQEYTPVFLENGDEVTIRYQKTMPSSRMFITKECEHPEVAFRIGDYMCSDEMTIWTRWGVKDVDWVEPDEGAEGIYSFLGFDAIIQSVTPWGSVQNGHWAQNTPAFRTTEVACGTSSTDKSQRSKAAAIKTLYDRYGEDLGVDLDDRIYKLVNTSEELDEIFTITNVIDSYIISSRYEFITGKRDIDKDWDAYIKELKASNVERLAELYQAAYDRMK